MEFGAYGTLGERAGIKGISDDLKKEVEKPTKTGIQS